MKLQYYKSLKLFITLAMAAGVFVFAQSRLMANSAVVVTIENMAPYSGTFQTPVWIGVHDGSFDSYDLGAAASALPSEGSNSIESIAEDGNVGPLTEEFAALVPNGVQGVVASNGPIPPLAPSQTASRMIRVDPTVNKYLSYASMVIPSNDAFIANGAPDAHPMFDADGNFVGEPFYVSGAEVNDAGTEVNDELPANTAFFGQAAPNTGVDENGVVSLHEGFNLGGGGILGAPMFFNADFLQDNYNMVRFSFAYLDLGRPLLLTADANTTFEIPTPTVDGSPSAQAFFLLTNGGTELLYLAFLDGLSGEATGAHLHLAPLGQTGPVVAPLRTFGSRFLFGRIRSEDVRGSLAGTDNPLDSLVAESISGNVYLNVHTEANRQGEVRGQLQTDSSF